MSDESPVRVLGCACQVLDCFSAATPRLRIADLRHLTGLPATTLARIARTLVAEQLLERDGDDYRLGLRVLVWTAPAMAGSELITAAGPVVERLRDFTGESTGLFVRHGANRVTVLAALSTYSVIYRAHIGQVRPLHAGAAGKLLMAYEPAAYRAVLRKGLTAYTAKTVTSPSQLRAHLESARSRGWAFGAEENEIGLNSVAVPVFGADGEIVAALAAGGPTFRLTRQAAEQMAPTMSAAGAALSQRLGDTAHAHSLRLSELIAERVN
jgi:IclR family acetate operon transcriptional repressor